MPWKIWPKRSAGRSAGQNVKTTDSRLPEEDPELQHGAVQRQPRGRRQGHRGTGGDSGRSLVCSSRCGRPPRHAVRGSVPGMTDQREVDVFQRRPGDGQAGDLAAQLLASRTTSPSGCRCGRSAAVRRQPADRCRCGGPAAELGGGIHGDDAPGRDHGDPACQRGRLVQVVRGEQDRGAAGGQALRSGPRTGGAPRGSKPVVGSSRKSSSGLPTMPSATSTRRRCPPDSCRSLASAFSVSPTAAMTSSGSRGSGK